LNPDSAIEPLRRHKRGADLEEKLTRAVSLTSN